MRTRAATSNSAVDAPSARWGRARTPVTPTHAEASEALSGGPAEIPPDVVALTWDLTVHRLHHAFARSIAPPVAGVLVAGRHRNWPGSGWLRLDMPLMRSKPLYIGCSPAPTAYANGAAA
jgi:hypothetical protein